MEREPESQFLNLPPVDHMWEAVEFLNMVGPVKFVGTGYQTLTFTDIRDWMETTGTHLNTWFVETLYRLSEIYVVQYYKSLDVTCPAPAYQDNRDEEEMRAEVNNKFREMAKRHNSKKQFKKAGKKK